MNNKNLTRKNVIIDLTILVSVCLFVYGLFKFTNNIGPSNKDVATHSNAVETEYLTLTFNDNAYKVSLGGKLDVSILEELSKFYGYSDMYESDMNAKLGTLEMLNAYLTANKEFIENNGDVTEDEVNTYVEGYYAVSDRRVLGGSSEEGYFTATLQNRTNEMIDLKDAQVQGLWLLDCKNIDVEYDGISTGDIYEDVSSMLSDYTKDETPDYSDMEYTKVGEGYNVSIYITDNIVNGIKLTY